MTTRRPTIAISSSIGLRCGSVRSVCSTAQRWSSGDTGVCPSSPSPSSTSSSSRSWSPAPLSSAVSASVNQWVDSFGLRSWKARSRPSVADASPRQLARRAYESRSSGETGSLAVHITYFCRASPMSSRSTRPGARAISSANTSERSSHASGCARPSKGPSASSPVSTPSR